MNTKTLEVLEAIKEAVAAGQTMIAPCTFSFCFPRASVSAAFRAAKQQGIIEVSYISCVGTPVYRGPSK